MDLSIDVVPDRGVAEVSALMLPGDDREVVIGLSPPSMGRDSISQGPAGLDRALGIQSAGQCQQPVFAELPPCSVDGLDQRVCVKHDEVPSTEAHRKLLVGCLIVEPPREVTNLADGWAQQVPCAALGAPPKRARVAGVADRKALIGGQVGGDDGGRESLRLRDFSELTIY